jgi:hypothetical protein
VPSDDDPPVSVRRGPAALLKTKPKPLHQKPVFRAAVSTPSNASLIKSVPIEKALSSPLQKISTVSKKLQAPPAQLPSTSTSFTSSRTLDVFDVPSSDDEKLSRSTKRTHKTMQKHVGTNTSKLVDIPDPLIEGNKKKPRLSPGLEISSKRPQSKAGVRPPRPYPATKAQQKTGASPKPGQVTNMVARPKIQPITKKIEAMKSPQRSSVPSQHVKAAPSTPSASGSDIEMKGTALTKEEHISPRGLQIWQDLLNSVEATEEVSSNINMSQPVPSSARTKPSGSSHSGILPKPLGVAKVSARAPRLLPRRRLIDSLVEQTQEESEDESLGDFSDPILDSMAASEQPLDVDHIPANQVRVQEVVNPPAMTTESQGSQAGPRITYTRVRSMLNEDDIMMDLEMELPILSESQNRRPRRVEVPGLKPLPSLHTTDEDDENTVAAIRSVHELRLAGTNNRFLDEIQDFLERISSPGKTPAATSMRRSGLLDLASKMKDKHFSQQFRDNGVEQKLFLHLGQEADTISGSIMVSLLITVLMEGSMPHIVSQLRRHGITRLIIRLLECHSSILTVSRERKSNMSKVSQSLLAEHQSHLIQLPVWEDLRPETISPRTLGLKCLELMVRQTREAGLTGDIFSKELTTSLFGIMNSASDMRCWDLPKDKSAIDFYLTVSALEFHSLQARTLHDETIWISDYLPTIAKTLEIALSRPSESWGAVQVLLLRLTLNVTNNNPQASEIFTKPALMSSLAHAAVVRFKMMSHFLTEEDLTVVLEHLILTLGVMINFAEWSSAARESLQGLQGQEGDALEALIHIFTDNREKTATVCIKAHRICYVSYKG